MSEASEVHPNEFVTVKVYVPAASPVIVFVVPTPEVVVPPGVLVIIQLPVAGKPLRVTLPVETKQVGCMMAPTIGAGGRVVGCALISTTDAPEVHPTELVTVKE